MKDVNNLIAFYAPAIICTGILMCSLFLSVMYKGMFFVFFVFVATAIRWLILPIGTNATANINTKYNCFAGQTVFKTTGNTTYSTFVIWFAMMYFLIPQIIQSAKFTTNMVNYGVLLFFLMYFFYDIQVKKSIQCIDLSWTSVGIGRMLADMFGGSAIAIIIVCIVYYSRGSHVLFINEVNSNNEVCTQPSKQQFKCSVYKNGELVKQTIK